MIGVYASRGHYARHLSPVLEALGDDAYPIGRAGQIPRDDTPLLIAGASDLDVTGRHPVALLEHGAGQRYVGLEHRSWGGGGLERVGLFLIPRAGVQPADRSVIVGCPALDRHAGRLREESRKPVVAFTFHVDFPAGRAIPELRSAFPHYRDHLAGIVAELRDAGCEVVGHFHPRYRGLERWWRKQGVTVEADWPTLLDRLDVLVVDSSSVGFEAMAVGRSVVWANAPWYRRDVEQGLRFWRDAGMGRQVDQPSEVVASVLDAVEHGPLVSAEEAMARVYTHTDGACAERAAVAVREWADVVASPP